MMMTTKEHLILESLKQNAFSHSFDIKATEAIKHLIQEVHRLQHQISLLKYKQDE